MRARILVVDDETDLEFLVVQKFRKEIRNQELAFEFACNGKEALAKLEEYEDIDIVLTDINMPEMDGLSLLLKIRDTRPTLRAIVVSAYGDMDNIRAAMNRGAYDFLTKPIDFDDLKITLERTITHVKQLKAMKRVEQEKQQAQEQALAQEKRAQRAQRKLIENLRRMDKLKDEFLAKTSHELRTPLNGIIGIVESLLDGVAGNLNQATLKNLEMVVASGKRLARLVDDILEFSKIKSGEISLFPKSIDLSSAVNTVLTLSEPLTAGKNLALVNEIEPGLPAALVDPNRLQQILFNLIGNAIKFTESGTVKVSASQVSDMIEIAVSDTGIGIPQESFGDIFEMFEQVGNDSAQPQSGIGLGLAITKKLVESGGGTIGVSSQMGKGSRFCFTVPVSRDKPVAPTGQDIPQPSVPIERAIDNNPWPKPVLRKGGVEILIVDDEPVNLQVLTNHLSLQNYAVVSADNGVDALRALNERRFALVILDVMMPGMSGLEVCKTLRQKFSLFELPVLMLTARNQVKDFVAGLEAGANDYVAKPFDKRELLARVRTLITLKEMVNVALSHYRELVREQNRTMLLESEKSVLEKQAQVAARGEAAALAASRKKTDFLTLMSHELRTPLNAIIGYSEILLEEMEEENQQAHLTDVLKIQSSGKALLAMINNLLDLSKIEAGKMDLYVEDFAMADLFGEAVATVQPMAAKNGNAIEMEIDEGLGSARGDMIKLNQVLLNLLANACKFTQRGTISLTAERCGDEDGTFLICVKDSGIGMSKDQMDRIFQPFIQGDQTTSKYYGGTGLGLVIAKRFCQMMGGDIGVESELGKGTSFTIRLPIHGPEKTRDLVGFSDAPAD